MQLPDRSQFLGRERNRKAAVHIAGPVLENERGKTAGIGKERLQLPADSLDVGGRLLLQLVRQHPKHLDVLDVPSLKHARPARRTLHDVLDGIVPQRTLHGTHEVKREPAQRRKKQYDDGPYEKILLS